MDKKIRIFAILGLVATGIYALNSSVFMGLLRNYFISLGNIENTVKIFSLCTSGLGLIANVVFLLAFFFLLSFGRRGSVLSAFFGIIGCALGIVCGTAYITVSILQLLSVYIPEWCNWALNLVSVFKIVFLLMSILLCELQISKGAKAYGIIGLSFILIISLILMIFNICRWICHFDPLEISMFYMAMNYLPSSFLWLLVMSPFAALLVTDKMPLATESIFTFKGRARRKEYWLTTMPFILLVVLDVLIVVIILFFVYKSTYNWELQLFSGIGVGCCTLAMLPETVRRFHDCNMSGWWVLLFSIFKQIPILGVIAGGVEVYIVGCREGAHGPNRFGPDQKSDKVDKDYVSKHTAVPHADLSKQVRAHLITQESPEVVAQPVSGMSENHCQPQVLNTQKTSDAVSFFSEKSLRLIKQSHDLRMRAEKLLQSSGVLVAWASIGAEVRCIGSYRSDLMMRNRNIDMHVYTGRLDVSATLLAFTPLLAKRSVTKFTYINCADTDEHCLKWHLQLKDDTGNIWTFDMIQILAGSRLDGHFEAITDAIANSVTLETKLIILELKSQTPPEMKPCEIEYCKAVISDGVRTWDEFVEWRKKNDRVNLFNWKP